MTTTDNGRRARFETEVLPHLDAMHRTAMRLTRNPSDADDLVQDAVVKAYRFFDSYEQGTNIRAWLLKIESNVFFSKYKRSAREGTMSALAAVDPIAEGWLSQASVAPTREPERLADRPLVEAEVSRALDDVSEDFRTVLVLVDIEGLTYREVADAMGCPIGTVMSRLHRARRAVAQRLGVRVGGAPAEEREVVSLDAYRRRKESVG